MQFGMPFLLENDSVESAAALGAELKLDFVELNMSFPLCQAERLSAEQLNALREKYGIYFTFHLHEEMDPCTFSTPVRKAWLAVAREAITLARQAHMPTVNLHWLRGVYITLPHMRDFLYNRYREEYLRNTLEFRKTCEEASQGQVKVCIENTEEGGWEPHRQESIELLLASPVFGLTLDVGHNALSKYADEPFYHKHADKLRHMHLHDATERQCHMPLGAGELDIAGLIGRAEAAHARAVLEIKTVAALRDSVQYLRDRGLWHV